jgi:hypothetical protein
MRSICQYLFLLAAISFSALADPTPVDPEILIDEGFGSPGITVPPGINQVQPCGSLSCTYDFINDTGGVITSFRFATTVNTGLSPSLFTCSDPKMYFLGCSANYTPTTGSLEYLFTGVKPPDGDENISLDTEFGEQEGIPVGGDFVITLKGWEPNAALFPNGTPQLSNGFTATPEPSQLLLLAVASLLLVSIVEIIRLKAKRKANNPTA